MQGWGDTWEGIAWISGEGASHFLRFFLTVCTLTFYTLGWEIGEA